MDLKNYLPPPEKCHLFTFFLGLLFSLFFTPMVAKKAKQLKLLDLPGGRHLHKQPTPRLGGLSIFLSILISSLILVIIYGRYTPKHTQFFPIEGIALGAILIFLVGLIDDLIPLSAWVKLLAQLIASVAAVVTKVKIKYLVNPFFYLGLSDLRVFELNPILAFFITIGWLVLITNALNLIDGIDGLAAGVALICALSLWAILLDPSLLNPGAALLISTLAGSILGFLRYNFNPAKIFLGDSGSYLVGFLLGAVAINSLSSNPNTASVGSVIILAFSFPLLDIFFAVLRRLVNKTPIMKADDGHIHHRFLKLGFNTKQTMIIICFTCTLLGLIATMLTNSYKRYAILVSMTLSLALLSTFWSRNK